MRYRPAAALALALALGLVPAVLPGAESAATAPPVVDPPKRSGSSDREEQHDLRWAVEGLLALAGDPFVGLGSLEPTALERTEPERLYALVTRDRAVRPRDYAPDDLVDLPGGLYQAREEVAVQLTALVAAAEREGHALTVTSGFRDHDTQAGTHDDWVRRVGRSQADKVSARPGHSEHQLGLAVDLAGRCSYDCFGDTPEGRWVAANAHRWGFIVRYPVGAEDVTGYAAEPWHLRYVGPRAAWAMHLRAPLLWDDFAPVVLERARGGAESSG